MSFVENGMIIRKEEEILEKFYQLNEGAIITVTGRRKVGKTTFINLFLKKKESFILKFSANNDFSSRQNLAQANKSLKMQIETLLSEPKILSLLNKSDDLNDPKNFKKINIENVIRNYINMEPTNCWIDFFSKISFVSEVLNKRKIHYNLVFDEVAWFSKKKDFLNAFANSFNNFLFTNSYCKVFLSSSTGSWIRSNILENKGSLYKREYLKPIHLEPFKLDDIINYCHYFNKQLSKETILEYYLMFGGVVKYYQLINFKNSFSSNLKFIKDHQDLFKNERKILLESLHNSNFISLAENILQILAKKKNVTIGKLEEELEYHLLKIMKQKNEKSEEVKRYFNNDGELKNVQLYKLMNDMVESGLLKKVNKENAIVKNAEYVLNDLFAYFEYYWDDKEIKEGIDYNNWKGNAFEIFTFNHFEKICEFLKIDFYKNNLYLNWKKKECQVDMIYKEQSTKQDFYHLVECKFYNQNKRLSEEQNKNIKRKCYQVFHTLNKDVVKVILVGLNDLSIDDNIMDFPYKTINIKKLFNF